MLLDISSLQDKILKRYEDKDVGLHEIPVIMQKMYENIAALAYFAQKVESEIKEKIFTPDFSLDQIKYILSDKITGVKISECLDVLCQEPHLDTIVDISADITITSDNNIKLIITPIHKNID